jgi:hypothetical protein
MSADRRSIVRKILVLPVALLVSFATATAASAAQPARWQIQTVTKPVSSSYSKLSSVACPTNDWCMSVGTAQPAGSGGNYAIAEVRTGASWHPVPVPGVFGANGVELSSVSCLSKTNCFAVGAWSSSAPGYRPLIMHWSGASWSLISAGIPTDLPVVLNLVECTSATSCVALGNQASGFPARSFLYAERWDGTVWRSSPIEAPLHGFDQAGLSSLSCASASVCFGVGLSIDNGNYYPLMERYANGSWSQVTPPLPAGSILTAVSCPTAKHCLAVGQRGFPGGSNGVYAVGWNGSGWRPSPAPRKVGDSNSFTAMSCRNATSCVGVGDTLAQNIQSPPYSHRLAGGTWTKLPVPQPAGSIGATLLSITCRPTGPCVAAGQSYDQDGYSSALGEILH